MLKHSLLLQLLHLLELTMEMLMKFTELAYLTRKMRYRKQCEDVYFVHISPILLCRVTYDHDLTIQNMNIICNIQLIASVFALRMVAVKKDEALCYYTTKILLYFVHKLHCILCETTNGTTEDYRLYYTELNIMLQILRQIVLHKVHLATYIHTNCIASTHSYVTCQLLATYVYLCIAQNCTTAQVVCDVHSQLVMQLATLLL